jgi:hypothetical protein
MGENVGFIAAIVTSPWFSLGLFILGALYIVFVGEAQRPLRHPFWPILGWAISIVVALAFWSVLVAGYVAANASQQTEAQVDERVKMLVEKRLEERLRPRELTDEQKKKLAEVLNVVPFEETYNLIIDSVPDCNKCWTFADSLITEWKKAPRWTVQRNGLISVDRRLVGIRFGFRSDCPREEIEVVKEALKVVGLIPNASPYTDKERDLAKPFLVTCQISVGSEPWE